MDKDKQQFWSDVWTAPGLARSSKFPIIAKTKRSFARFGNFISASEMWREVRQDWSKMENLLIKQNSKHHFWQPPE